MAKITQQEFADFVGITRQAVSKMCREGILDLSFGLETAVLVYCERLREQAAGRMGHSGEYDDVYDLTAERARLAHHQANKTELEEKVLREDLVPSDDVFELLETVISNARAKLLTLPVKVAQVAIHAKDLKEIESDVQVLIHEALEELSQSNGTSGNSRKGARRLGTSAALNS